MTTKKNKPEDAAVVWAAVSTVMAAVLAVMLIFSIWTRPQTKYGSIGPEDWAVAQRICAGGKILSVWLSENDEEISAHCVLGTGFFSAKFKRSAPSVKY